MTLLFAFSIFKFSGNCLTKDPLLNVSLNVLSISEKMAPNLGKIKNLVQDCSPFDLLYANLNLKNICLNRLTSLEQRHAKITFQYKFYVDYCYISQNALHV